MANFFDTGISRRTFMAGSVAGLSALPMFSAARTRPRYTVQQLINLILKDIPGQVANTVDTIKVGDPNQQITKVVTTMFPTIAVIKKAIALKANFIIVHEPSFYNHADDTAWLAGDEVFEFKRSLLEKNKIVLWRFHDYIHRHNPDGILEGVVSRLNWKKFQDPNQPFLFTLPVMQSLSSIVSHAKKSLDIPALRIVGKMEDECKRVVLLPGAWGGRNQIKQLMDLKPDLLIVGEVSEWETSEYIRDAREMGLKRSLIVLGHSQSEEPGLEWLAQWLKENAGDVPVVHIPSDNPFTFA